MLVGDALRAMYRELLFQWLRRLAIVIAVVLLCFWLASLMS